jgi:ABC-type transport system substrate-binding protein
MRDAKRILALLPVVGALVLLAVAQMTLARAAPLSPNQTSVAGQGEDGWPPLYRVAMVEDISTTNYWAYLGRDQSAPNGYVLNSTVHSLFALSDQSYDFIPRLAAGFGLDPDASEQWWIINIPLRQGIQWSDGTSFTAADVAFTLQTCADPALGLEGGWPTRCPAALDRVEASGDYTVTYYFTQSVGIGTWAADVAMAPILPRHYWEPVVRQAKTQPDPAAYLYDHVPVREPVLGPFRLVKWQPGDYAETERNSLYYFQGLEVQHYANGAYSETLPGAYTFAAFGDPTGPVDLSFTVGPHVRGVLYLIYGSDGEAYQALQDGEVDIVLNPQRVHPDLRGPLESDPEVATMRNAGWGMWYLAFNLRREPMSIPGFREAVATLVDREFPGTLVPDYADPLWGVVPEGNHFWYHPGAPRIGQGLTRQQRISDAVNLLTTSGFTWTVEPDWDPQGERVLPGRGLHYGGEPVPEIELLAPNFEYDEVRATEALSIEQWLDEAGISVTVVLSDFNPIVDRVFNQVDFDTYILGWSLDNKAFPRYLESFFHSRQDTLVSGGSNTPGYNSPLYDVLVDQFMATPDRAHAQSLAYSMQVTLATDLPYVTLHTIEAFDAFREERLIFPYTITLSGLVGQAGLPALVLPVAESVTVEPETGGTLTYTDTQGLTTTVEVPPGAVTETTTFVYDALVSPTVPLSSELCFAGHAFDLSAYCPVVYSVYLPLVVNGFSPGNSATSPDRDVTGYASDSPGSECAGGSLAQGDLRPCGQAFAQPVTVTIHYSDGDVSCLNDESTLRLYYWTGTQWADAATTCMPTSSYDHDLPGNVIGVEICHLTQYAIGGK